MVKVKICANKSVEDAKMSIDAGVKDKYKVKKFVENAKNIFSI